MLIKRNDSDEVVRKITHLAAGDIFRYDDAEYIVLDFFAESVKCFCVNTLTIQSIKNKTVVYHTGKVCIV